MEHYVVFTAREENQMKLQITEVTVGYGRTINLENFNSMRIDCTLTATIESGQDHQEAAEYLRSECRRQCQLEAERLANQIGGTA